MVRTEFFGSCPKKSMHPPFSDKCHLTISSPRSFAALIFSQTAIFPKNSLKVDSIFSAKSLVFHSHFPPKKLWLFHDFSTICPSIFPAFSNRFSWFPGPPLLPQPVSHHDVGRGKGLGKDAGAAQAGELRRLIRLAAQVGAPGALVEDRMPGGWGDIH